MTSSRPDPCGLKPQALVAVCASTVSHPPSVLDFGDVALLSSLLAKPPTHFLGSITVNVTMLQPAAWQKCLQMFFTDVCVCVSGGRLRNQL